MTAGTRHEDSPALQGQRAGLVSRTVAAAVDAAVVMVFALGTEFGAAVAVYVVLGPPFRLPDLSSWAATVWWYALAVGYLAWGWVTAGRTIGNQLMGLRVVGRSGRRLGVARAVLRAGLCVIAPVGLLWVPFSRRNASAQDLIVRSTVVYDWYYEPPGSPATDDAAPGPHGVPFGARRSAADK